MRRGGCAWLVTAIALAFGAPLHAQVRPDSAQASDTLVVGAPGDSLPQQPDSVPPDTIFYNLPSLDAGAPAGFATGVWVWDHAEIMGSGANTLAELVAEVPGVVTLLGGDYGTPAAISAFGTGGGGVRIVRDGFEVMPLEGGMADLQRVGLGGITRVRFERSGGEMLIELTSHQHAEGRAYSLIEAGTGQLDTNMFRGMYADPTALRGSLAIALERVDTRGYGQNEGGNRTGYWLRYQLHAGNRAGLAFEMRRMGSETQVPAYASSLSRVELTARGRVALASWLVAEAYTGRTSHDVDDVDSLYAYEGGTRAQHGGRLLATRGGAWARGEFRYFSREDLPLYRFDTSLGYAGARFGLAGRASRSEWRERDVIGYAGSAWATPLPGITVFGSWDEGTYAARSGPPQDVTPDSLPSFGPTPLGYATTDRRVLRVGGSITVTGVTLAAAALRTKAAVHLPLGLELDRGAPSVPGQEREGIEAWGVFPTPWRSLRLEGSYQRWDVEGPYLPKEIYQGAFVFRKTYLETGNFELWWTVGVRGHDPMQVFVGGASPGLATVPFYQSWYGRVQARILTVRLYLGWENFTIRRNLQNFPGRVLPVTRSFFGLHWDLWN